MTAAPASRAASASASKSTWAVRSCSPGLSSTGAKRVRAHRLQRVARRARLMPVIDDQRDAAVRGQALRQCCCGIAARRRLLDDLAVAVERQAAGCGDDPALHAADELLHRQRVEEFVGDDQQRRLREGRPASSCQAAPGTARACACAQHRAGLDEVSRRVEARPSRSPAAHRQPACRAPAQARHRPRPPAFPRAPSNRRGRRRPSRRTSG